MFGWGKGGNPPAVKGMFFWGGFWHDLRNTTTHLGISDCIFQSLVIIGHWSRCAVPLCCPHPALKMKCPRGHFFLQKRATKPHPKTVNQGKADGFLPNLPAVLSGHIQILLDRSTDSTGPLFLEVHQHNNQIQPRIDGMKLWLDNDRSILFSSWNFHVSLLGDGIFHLRTL